MMSFNLPPVNFLSFDIEDWYHVNYPQEQVPLTNRQDSSLSGLVDRLIDLCARYNIKTTCFIVGEVAKARPEIVKKLYQAGHEIAAHGYTHDLVYKMSPDAFREDLRKTCAILEHITGEKVIGFRAPSWSVKRNILKWYYPILAEAGLKYSSSVFPGKTFLYGIEGFPEYIHYPDIDGQKYNILEIPAPVVKLGGLKIGLYLRFFPGWFLIRHMRRSNEKGTPVMLYVHPREIDLHQPRILVPWYISLLHYWGIPGCERKLCLVMKSGQRTFIRVKDFIKNLEDKDLLKTKERI